MYDIPRGITRLDITGDGKPETLLKALRENNNAHSYDVTLLIDGEKTPSLIGIEGEDTAHELISTAEGECRLQGNRLLAGRKGRPFTLITADRSLAEGQDFCAAVPVTFHFFMLMENRESLPGWPRFYFKSFRKWTPDRNYADVTDAVKENEERLVRLAQ